MFADDENWDLKDVHMQIEQSGLLQLKGFEYIVQLLVEECENKNLQVYEVLDTMFDDEDKRLEFSRWIHKSFPAEAGVKYSANFDQTNMLSSTLWHCSGAEHQF